MRPKPQQLETRTISAAIFDDQPQSAVVYAIGHVDRGEFAKHVRTSEVGNIAQGMREAATAENVVHVTIQWASGYEMLVTAVVFQPEEVDK